MKIVVFGPELLRLDELIRRLLTARDDSREVVTDPHASYWGISPSEVSLLPREHARLGMARFEDSVRNGTVHAPSNESRLVTAASRA